MNCRSKSELAGNKGTRTIRGGSQSGTGALPAPTKGRPVFTPLLKELITQLLQGTVVGSEGRAVTRARQKSVT